MSSILPVVLASAVLAAPLSAARTLDDCRREVRFRGPTEAAGECYFEVGWEAKELRSAVKLELGELIARHPDAAWLHYFRGRLPPWWLEGEPYIRRAAELFADRQEISAELRARANLVTLHGFAAQDSPADADSEFAAAGQELERMHTLLESSALPEDRGVVALAEAHYRLLKGIDLGEAYALLVEAEELLQQAPPKYYYELKDCYRSLIQVTTELGLPWGPSLWAEKAERAALERGSLRDIVFATHNAIYTHLRSASPNDESRRDLIGRLHETLAMAQAAGHESAEASSRHLLSLLESGPEARSHLDRCLAIATEVREPNIRSSCILSLATLSLDSAPEQARALLETAHTGEQVEIWTLLEGWADQMRVLWETSSKQDALEHAQTILDAIETLRRGQSGEASDLLLSEWADPYYWLSGRLLSGAPGPAELGLSFAVIERLRVQTLREALASPPASPAGEPDPRASELQKAYVEVYRGLLDPGLGSREREVLRDRLTELERIESRLERQSAPRPVLAPPEPDLLERVRAALGGDEALLSYQLGMWEGWDQRFLGGSWLTVTTRERTRVYRLDGDAATLGRRVRALLRLDDPERPGALARLHGDLMQPALSELAPTIRKLIVIPDGYLHLLPFSLLRESDDAPPLVERFDIQIVPSAAIWLDWQGRPAAATSAPRPALVLANPRIASDDMPSGARGELESGYALGPLPYAEQEGRRVLKRLGGQGRLESGSDASERFLKSADLASYRVIHFAAHAISNPSKPERSAVMLAAGDGDEDGFLRPSEIARLRGLEGKLVVLAACDSARGHVLRGEGALSLARAFFEAGAHAVVASLWRLDDRQATEFFDDFYQRLRQGASVGRALADTQRAWSAAGLPAATWAGLVVLGDGDLVPIPGGVAGGPLDPYALPVVLLAVLALMAVPLWRR